MEQKPGFLQSLGAGAIGMVKGMALLGVAGFLLGGVVGGIFALSSQMAAAPVALAFAAACAELGAAIGGIAGAVTGVVQSREAAAPSAQNLANIANMAYAQGVSAGRDKDVSPASLDAVEQASTRFQDRIKAEPPREASR